MDEVLKEAKAISNRLGKTAGELRHIASYPDAITCEQARIMLRKLGLEVTRLRCAIGHFQYGRLSRERLCRIPETWNNP